jgi:PAS domain S-box-containing protein
MCCKGNREIWVETTTRVMHDPETDDVYEIICVSRDITERKLAEEAIQEREQKYTALFNSSLDAIFIADDEGRYRDVNPAASTLFGLPHQEMIGKHLIDLVGPGWSSHIREVWHGLLDSGEMVTEVRYLHPDGQYRDFEVRSRANFLPGRHLSLVRDITERKQAEQALREAHSHLERRVEERTAELRVANEEVRRFAYIVSHDLRAPLINIQGFVAELRSSLNIIERATEDLLPNLDADQSEAVWLALKEDIPEAFDFIHSAVERMDHFINAILRLSRLGRRELHPEPVDLEDLIETVLKSLAHQIVERKATVMLSALPTITADRTAMEQIVGNILTNAVLYLDPQRPGEIDICIIPDERETLFKIHDNGRGIAEEDKPKVFEPFRRAGRQTVPGEGMGLAYVQTLIRRHGGRIWFESTEGVGTTFWFTIPNELTDGTEAE